VTLLSWTLGLALAGWAHALAMAWPWPAIPLLGVEAGEPVPWLQWAALTMLAWGLRQQTSAARAAWVAWWFGTAWLAGTFWWLFVSMHRYGGLSAGLSVAAVWALAAALSLYVAAAGAWAWRWRTAGPWGYAAVWTSVWLLAEWARATWFTGFPWGAAGYAHVDSMAVWAPWVGVYGLGAISAALAGWWAAGGWRRRGPARMLAALGLLPMAWPALAVWLAALQPSLTTPVGVLPVALLQGNIPQNEKFEPGAGVPLALSWYPSATRQALERLDAQGGGLVVAPETALPLLPSEMDPAWWTQWLQAIADSRSAVMVGLPLGDSQQGYSNSVAAWTPTLEMYRYDKHHLVPFGEFVPPLFRWFTQRLQMPLGDFARGPLGQPPLLWAGQRIAPHICYEDLFGEELAVSFRRADLAPTVLVNVSNIAWFGNTVAIDQHRHISRMRALELQRPLVRSTNTGSTVLIDHRGQVISELPRLTRDVLYGQVEGRAGITPYAWWVSRWGLWPWVLLALGTLAVFEWRRRDRAPD